jgi:hypothetical protein
MDDYLEIKLPDAALRIMVPCGRRPLIGLRPVVARRRMRRIVEVLEGQPGGRRRDRRHARARRARLRPSPLRRVATPPEAATGRARPTRTAHEMLAAMGFQAFAERAARELRATGGTVTGSGPDTAGALTAQEAQIARLARD